MFILEARTSSNITNVHKKYNVATREIRGREREFLEALGTRIVGYLEEEHDATALSHRHQPYTGGLRDSIGYRVMMASGVPTLQVGLFLGAGGRGGNDPHAYVPSVLYGWNRSVSPPTYEGSPFVQWVEARIAPGIATGGRPLSARSLAIAIGKRWMQGDYEPTPRPNFVERVLRPGGGRSFRDSFQDPYAQAIAAFRTSKADSIFRRAKLKAVGRLSP